MKILKKIFFITLIARLLIALGMPPSTDEAYYYVYSLYPDLSYFDHPPVVAWIGGMIPGLFNWINSFSIRLGPIILFTISIYLFLKLAELMMSKEESIMAASVFMLVPMFFLSGTFLLPDAALIFFWVLGLYVFKITMDAPILRNWFFLGVVTGLGMLSKYTAGFLYIGGIMYLLLNKKYRFLLLTPGPYIAVIVSLLVFSPVILWNIEHGFTSFLFQTSRVGISGIKFRYFYQSLFGQMGYLMPFVFFPAVYFAGKSLKERDELNTVVFCFGAIPVLFFMSASMFKRVLPHWPVIGYITLVLPVGKFYYELYKRKRKLFNKYCFCHILIVFVLIVLAILQVNTGILINRELPADLREKKAGVRDISIDIIGWKELEGYLKSSFSKDEIFLFTHKWYLAGHISFAVQGKYPVLCLNDKKSIRGFSIWQNQKEYLGRDGLFICTSKFFSYPESKYSNYFDNIKLIQAIPVRRSNKLVKIIYVYKCTNFKKTFLL